MRQFVAKKKSYLLLGLILCFVLVGVFVAGHQAHAIIDWIAGDLLAPLITKILIPLISWLLLQMVSILIWISQYNDFINAGAVVNGWAMVRDMANMFFIIVLLIIAFGTILGREEYHYKKLLPTLVIMALLINFSRTIAGLLIDAAQVVMMTFVNGYSAAAGGNFANALQIDKIMKFEENQGSIKGLQLVGFAILALIILIISFIFVAVMVAVLAFRIFMLWILIILSPIAWLLGTFPQGQKYYAQWWDEFRNQVVVGPVLAFFLWLTLATVGSGTGYRELQGNRPDLKDQEAAGVFPKFAEAQTQMFTTNALVSYIVTIGMLMAGLQVSQQMGGAIAGIAGKARGMAKGALKMGAKGMLMPVKFGAKKGIQYGERKLLDFSTREGGGLFRKSLKYLTPTAWRGLGQRGKGLLEESRAVAMNEAEEESHYIFTLGKRRLPLREVAEHGLTAKYAKDFSVLSKEAIMDKSVELEKLGGIEGERARAAIISTAAHKGYLDDMMRMPYFRKKIVKQGQKKYGYTDRTFSNKYLQQDFLLDYATGLGVGTGKGEEAVKTNADRWQYQLRMLTALEEPGKAVKHWEYLGYARYNPTTKKYEAGDKKWLADYAREEYNKIGDRDRAGTAPHATMALRETGDGEFDVDAYGTITDAERGIRTALTPALYKEARGMQGRHAEWALGAETILDPDNKKVRMIVGDKEMADYIENTNEENSDYAFGLYARRAGLEFTTALQQGSFKIVDREGKLIREIEYKGPPVSEEVPAAPASAAVPAPEATQAPSPAAPPAPSPARPGTAPAPAVEVDISPEIIPQMQINETVQAQIGDVNSNLSADIKNITESQFEAIKKALGELTKQMEKMGKDKFGKIGNQISNLVEQFRTTKYNLENIRRIFTPQNLETLRRFMLTLQRKKK